MHSNPPKSGWSLATSALIISGLGIILFNVILIISDHMAHERAVPVRAHYANDIEYARAIESPIRRANIGLGLSYCASALILGLIKRKRK